MIDGCAEGKPPGAQASPKGKLSAELTDGGIAGRHCRWQKKAACNFRSGRKMQGSAQARSIFRAPQGGTMVEKGDALRPRFFLNRRGFCRAVKEAARVIPDRRRGGARPARGHALFARVREGQAPPLRGSTGNKGGSPGKAALVFCPHSGASRRRSYPRTAWRRNASDLGRPFLSSTGRGGFFLFGQAPKRKNRGRKGGSFGSGGPQFPSSVSSADIAPPGLRTENA